MPRLLRIAAISEAYSRQFFLARPELLDATYSGMKAALDADGASSAPAYSAAFSRLGYDCDDIFPNVIPLQRRWASERGIPIADIAEVAVRQAIEFRPEILWFDSPDGELMRRLRAALPTLRLAVG